MHWDETTFESRSNLFMLGPHSGYITNPAAINKSVCLISGKCIIHHGILDSVDNYPRLICNEARILFMSRKYHQVSYHYHGSNAFGMERSFSLLGWWRGLVVWVSDRLA